MKATKASTGTRTSVYELVIEMPTSWRGDTHGEKLMQYIYRSVPNRPLTQQLPGLLKDPSIGGALLKRFAPEDDKSSILRGPAYIYKRSKHKDRWGFKVVEKQYLYRVYIETYIIEQKEILNNPNNDKIYEILPVVIHAAYRDWNGVHQSKALPLLAFIRKVSLEDADSFPSPTLSSYKHYGLKISHEYATLIADDASRINVLYNDCLRRHEERNINEPSKFCISKISGHRLPDNDKINVADFVLRALKYKLENAPRSVGFSEIDYVVRLMEGKKIADTFLKDAPTRTEQTMPQLVSTVEQQNEPEGRPTSKPGKFSFDVSKLRYPIQKITFPISNKISLEQFLIDVIAYMLLHHGYIKPEAFLPQKYIESIYPKSNDPLDDRLNKLWEALNEPYSIKAYWRSLSSIDDSFGLAKIIGKTRLESNKSLYIYGKDAEHASVSENLAWPVWLFTAYTLAWSRFRALVSDSRYTEYGVYANNIFNNILKSRNSKSVDRHNENVTEDHPAWENKPEDRTTKEEQSFFEKIEFEWHKPDSYQSDSSLYTDKQLKYMIALVRKIGGDPSGADGFYDWLRKILEKGSRHMSKKTASEIIANLKEGKHVFFGDEHDLEILKYRIEKRRANEPNPYKKYVEKSISVIDNLHISKLYINGKPEYKYDILKKGYRVLVYFLGNYPNSILGTYTDPKTKKKLDFGIKGSIYVTQKGGRNKWEVVSIETKDFDINSKDYELFPSHIKENKHFLDELRAAIDVKVKKAANDYFMGKNEKYEEPDWRNETVNEPEEQTTQQPIKQPTQPQPMPKTRKTASRRKAKDDFKPIQSSQKLVSAIRAFKQYENLQLHEKDVNSLYYRITEALLDAKKGDHFAQLGREIQRKLDKIRQSITSWPTQPLRFTKPTSYKLMCFERDCEAAWSKIQLGSVASAVDVAAANFQTWAVPGAYGRLLGNVADGFHLVIWGLPGSGKSTFALGLANALAEVGSTLYISAEEGAGATMQERLRRVGAAPNLFISGAGSVEQARSTIAGGDFRFVVLDSVDTLRASVEDVERLKRDFLNVAFITIHQATKLNQMRGSLEYAHNADVIVRVNAGKAETTKNRYAPLCSVDVAFNGVSAQGSNRDKPAGRRLVKSGRSAKDDLISRKLRSAGSVVSFKTKDGKRVEFCANTTRGKPAGRCFSGFGKATSCNTKDQTSAEIMFQGCAETVSINDALEADISFKANDKYAEITREVISAIEKGVGDGVWELPWSKSLAATDRPFNPITGRYYRGVNMLQLLNEFSKRKMYNANYWATPKQWQEAGFELKPLKHKKTGIETMWVKIGRMKKINGHLTYSKSFELVNSFFVKGAEEYFADNKVILNDPIINLPEDIMKLVNNTGVEIKWAKSARGAWYSPIFDYINMPPKSSFKEKWGLVSILVHELVHWTGHESRLNRVEKIGKRYAANSYAFEELVAELGATFICADYKITNTLREDHVKYLASWLDAFKRNSRILFEASNFAQEAVEYIYSFSNASLKGIECASCFDLE